MDPSLEPTAWYSVVANVPPEVTALGNQRIAAWKKWLGVAYMMDLGYHLAPRYGLLLDAELMLFNASDCGPTSAWSSLGSRIMTREMSRSWPAARVGTSNSYNFGDYNMTGKDYDRYLIEENFNFVTHGKSVMCPLCCQSTECGIIKEQIETVQFSWWTDLPYVNLKIAEGMFMDLANTSANHQSLQEWRDMCKRIKWPRFEHIAYQHWCVLNHGYKFQDVTDLTGLANWGSYLEDPPPGANLEPLAPLWASARGVARADSGEIEPLSTTEPPLLIFHADKENFVVGEHKQDAFDIWKASSLKAGFTWSEG